MLKAVLEKKANKPAPAAQAEEQLGDGFLIESEQEYRERLGRWSKDTLNLLESPAFAWVLSVCHKCRGPVMKCMRLIKTKHGKATNLADLVYTRAAEIMEDFMALLKLDHWKQEAGSLQLGQPDESDVSSTSSALAACVILLAMTGAAEYHRRVYTQTQTYPLQLLWLVFSPWSVHCPERQRVARHLLNQSDRDLEPNALRLRTWFLAELQETASSGKICAKVHAFLAAVRHLWTCDTQEQEGAHSMISAMVARATHIGLPLLAGRLTVKKALFNQVSSIQHSAKKAGDRVASRLAVKELVRRSCTLLGEAADNVQHDLARWAPPKAADAALPVNAGCLPQVRPPPVRQACRQWCGHYHPQLVKAMCLGNPLVAYCLKADGVFQNKAWLCLNRIRKVRCLVDCTISLEGGQPKRLRVS